MHRCQGSSRDTGIPPTHVQRILLLYVTCLYWFVTFFVIVIYA